MQSHDSLYVSALGNFLLLLWFNISVVSYYKMLLVTLAAYPFVWMSLSGYIIFYGNVEVDHYHRHMVSNIIFSVFDIHFSFVYLLPLWFDFGLQITALLIQSFFPGDLAYCSYEWAIFLVFPLLRLLQWELRDLYDFSLFKILLHKFSL